jgi:Polysaccharide deacetylase
MVGKHGPMYRPTNRKRLGADFRWKNGKKVAIIVNVPFEGWSEGAHSGVGPMGNVLRPGVLDTNAVSWGLYGATRGIQRCLRILDRNNIQATMMVNGAIAELYPESVRACTEQGHCVLAHAYAMDTIPVYLSREDEAANIQRTGDLIKAATGKKPRGWISPRGTNSLNTPELLIAAGYDWHGDAFDDDLPYLETHANGSIVAIPLTMEVNDMPMSVRYGNLPSRMVESFKQTMEWLVREEPDAGLIDITVHTHVYGRPSGAVVFDELLKVAKSYSDAWIATRDEVCDHVRGPLGAK